MAEKIAKRFGVFLGEVSTVHFSDGEFEPSFDETVRGCDVFIVQSTPPPSENLMELLLMIDAAKRASAHKIVAVMPYFGYARQDKKGKPSKKEVLDFVKDKRNGLDREYSNRYLSEDLSLIHI